MSRPPSSVPNQFVDDGGSNRFLGARLTGSYGAMTGAAMAIPNMPTARTKPIMLTGLARNREPTCPTQLVCLARLADPLMVLDGSTAVVLALTST